jgi:hypothetical protein
VHGPQLSQPAELRRVADHHEQEADDARRHEQARERRAQVPHLAREQGVGRGLEGDETPDGQGGGKRQVAVHPP